MKSLATVCFLLFSGCGYHLVKAEVAAPVEVCAAAPVELYGIPIFQCFDPISTVSGELLCCGYRQVVDIEGLGRAYCAYVLCRDACHGEWELALGNCSEPEKTGGKAIHFL